MNNIESIIEESKDKLSFSNKKPKRTCLYCGKPMPNSSTSKKYCSEECRWKDKGYPSIEEVNKQYDILKSWEKVAQHFNLTRKIIQGIRKRAS